MTTDTWTQDNVRFEVRRDEHKQPGIAFGKATFVETGISATGFANEIVIERWSDGGWRAPGQRAPSKTPHEAFEKWVYVP